MRKSFVRLRSDHKGHFKLGFGVALIITLLGWPFMRLDALVLAVLVGALLVGWGKEFYDGITGRGTPDYSDALITIAPSSHVVVCILLAARAIKYFEAFPWVL